MPDTDRPPVWSTVARLRDLTLTVHADEYGGVHLGDHAPITATDAVYVATVLRELADAVQAEARRARFPITVSEVLDHLHGERESGRLDDTSGFDGEPCIPWAVDDYGDVWYARDGWGWIELWRGE